MNKYHTRTNCRLCNSPELDMIYEMPKCPPVDNFRQIGESAILTPNFPMNLYLCRACGHAQLLDVVDPIILYGDYIYTSSSSTDLELHFSAYAAQVIEFFSLAAGSKVLDIGSNDGLLLTKFQQLGLNVYGVDPSFYVATEASKKGIETLVSYFNCDSAKVILSTVGSFDLVTANNVFSHADDLRDFAESVCNVLSRKGAFVFEVSYLKDLVDNLVIDYVYHEHLCHHSVKPLQQFLFSCGLKLIRVERINTKGGSIRCYAVKLDNPFSVDPIVAEMIADELSAGLYNVSTYQTLKLKIDTIATEVRARLEKAVSDGGMVAAYGASATSTVLNSLLGINHLISFIVDDNVLRQNRLSPGFMIPVLSPEALAKYRPACVLVSAWRFVDNIVASNPRYLSTGGRFVIPLPGIKEITK